MQGVQRGVRPQRSQLQRLRRPVLQVSEGAVSAKRALRHLQPRTVAIRLGGGRPCLPARGAVSERKQLLWVWVTAVPTDVACPLVISATAEPSGLGPAVVPPDLPPHSPPSHPPLAGLAGRWAVPTAPASSAPTPTAPVAVAGLRPASSACVAIPLAAAAVCGAGGERRHTWHQPTSFCS